VGACNGIVVGLVAITPGCGYVTVGSSLVIGLMACLVCYAVGWVIKERSSVDDSLDVFAVHGVGGLVGFLSTGIFASLQVNPGGADGLIYGQGMLLAKHIAIVCAMCPMLIIVTFLIMAFVDKCIIPVRVSEEDELMGLDKSMHSEEFGHVPVWSPNSDLDQMIRKGSTPQKYNSKPSDALDSSVHSQRSVEETIKAVLSSTKAAVSRTLE
jgi:ammonia channel protein AmtB